MRFLNPLGLLGLAIVPAIIGLHLHLERNRRVIVSSMFLWSFLDVRFEGKKPKFVRLSLLLLLDVLIAMLLSGAFARPVLLLPSTQVQDFDQVVLIDNSTSMLTVEDGVERFSLAATMAVSLLQEAPVDTDTLVVAIGGGVEIIGSTRELSRNELATRIGSLTAGGNGIQLREGLSLASAFADLEKPVRVFVLTDAAYAQPDFADFSLPIEWVFLGFETNNQAIVNSSIRAKGQNGTEVFFQVVNFAGVEVSRDVVLYMGGIEVQRIPVVVPANSLMTQTVEVNGTLKTVEINLEGSDSFRADDIARLSNITQRSVRVALVAEMPYPIDRAVEANLNVNLTVIPPQDYSPAGNYDLMIFRGFVPDNFPQGVSLVFDSSGSSLIPNNQMTANGAESAFEVKRHEVLSGIDFNTVLFQGVQEVNLLPAIDEGYTVTELVNDGEKPIYLLLEKGEQNIFLFLPDLNNGNFTGKPAFPVLISNVIDYASQLDLAQYYYLGEYLEFADAKGLIPSKLYVPNQDEAVDILGVDEVRLDQAGFYSIEFLDEYGRTNAFSFGVNAGSFAESDISPQDWRVNYSSEMTEDESERQIVEFDLSPFLLVMAVLLMVVEAWRAWR